MVPSSIENYAMQYIVVYYSGSIMGFRFQSFSLQIRFLNPKIPRPNSEEP